MISDSEAHTNLCPQMRHGNRKMSQLSRLIRFSMSPNSSHKARPEICNASPVIEPSPLTSMQLESSSYEKICWRASSGLEIDSVNLRSLFLQFTFFNFTAHTRSTAGITSTIHFRLSSMAERSTFHKLSHMCHVLRCDAWTSAVSCSLVPDVIAQHLLSLDMNTVSDHHSKSTALVLMSNLGPFLSLDGLYPSFA